MPNVILQLVLTHTTVAVCLELRFTANFWPAWSMEKPSVKFDVNSRVMAVGQCVNKHFLYLIKWELFHGICSFMPASPAALFGRKLLLRQLSNTWSFTKDYNKTMVWGAGTPPKLSRCWPSWFPPKHNNILPLPILSD